MKKTCYIVDDEQGTVDALRLKVEKTGLLTVLGCHISPALAIPEILELKPDLVITDVQMPQMDGTEMAIIIQQSHPCKFIFITGFPDFALASFKVDVIHYLIKPVEFTDLYAAITKFLRITGSIAADAGNTVDKSEQPALKVSILTTNESRQIALGDIAYIQSLQKYASVVLKTGQVIHIRESLKGLLRSLPSDKFLRAQRSYIISLDGLKEEHITAYDLHLPFTDTTITINRETRKTLKSFFEGMKTG
jgi:DNA-binding LytR/AlgR family response regulator